MNDLDTSTWRQLVAIVDGKRTPMESAKVVLKKSGENYTVSAMGKVIQRGVSKANREVSPHTSDVTVTEGLHAGASLRQIFRIDDDVMVSCIAKQGAERPTAFESKPGSGHTLSVWIRVNEGEVAAEPSQAKSLLSIVGAIMLCQIVFGNRNEFVPHVGYFGSLFAAILLSGILVAVVWRCLRWSWQEGLTAGLSLSVLLLTFDELKKAIEPTLGAFGAVTVSGCTAVVIAMTLGTLFSRLTSLVGDSSERRA